MIKRIYTSSKTYFVFIMDKFIRLFAEFNHCLTMNFINQYRRLKLYSQCDKNKIRKLVNSVNLNLQEIAWR